MITLFAQAPALPLHAAGKYVAGAYIVFVLMIVIYVAIMVRRLQSNQREIMEMKALLDARERSAAGLAGPAADPTPAEDELDGAGGERPGGVGVEAGEGAGGVGVA